jgi:hypothetical protein
MKTILALVLLAAATASASWTTELVYSDGKWRSVFEGDMNPSIIEFTTEAQIDYYYDTALAIFGDKMVGHSECTPQGWTVRCDNSGSGCRSMSKKAAKYNLKLAEILN